MTIEQCLAKDDELGLSDREIIEDMAVVNWIDPSQPTRKIIFDLLTQKSLEALDPAISERAVDLYLQGYSDGKAMEKERYTR